MALGRTLSLSSSLLSKHSIHQNKLPIASFFPFLSHLYAAKPLQFATHFPKCSSTESYTSYSVTYPKPPEIPWNKELCNSVSLIGTVGVPVGLKRLASGKDLAWTRLAVWKSSTETFWVNLAFWNELAHVAFQHVRKDNLIYVSGRLVADLVEANDVKQQTYYKVVVQQLNFIDRRYATTPNYDQNSNSEMTGAKLGTSGGAVDIMGSTEELWKAFFANPAVWWDNRNNKKNPKYPDFKRKDTGEALWVEDRYNPPWVKPQLAMLDMKKGSSLDEQEATMIKLCS